MSDRIPTWKYRNLPYGGSTGLIGGLFILLVDPAEMNRNTEIPGMLRAIADEIEERDKQLEMYLGKSEVKRE